MSTALESNVRIQLDDFVVTDEIEAIKKVSPNIGGIVLDYLGCLHSICAEKSRQHDYRSNSSSTGSARFRRHGSCLERRCFPKGNASGREIS